MFALAMAERRVTTLAAFEPVAIGSTIYDAWIEILHDLRVPEDSVELLGTAAGRNAGPNILRILPQLRRHGRSR